MNSRDKRASTNKQRRAPLKTIENVPPTPLTQKRSAKSNAGSKNKNPTTQLKKVKLSAIKVSDVYYIHNR